MKYSVILISHTDDEEVIAKNLSYDNAIERRKKRRLNTSTIELLLDVLI